MFRTALMWLVLGQSPQATLADVTSPVDITETCWGLAPQFGFTGGYGGFGGLGGSYRARSFAFDEEEFGAAPTFGGGFGLGGGFGVPYPSSFSLGIGPSFGTSFVGGFGFPLGPGSGYGLGPRIKIKNKIKFHGRRW